MKALLVPVDGMPREVEVDGLKDLQAAVGGYIEPCSWIFNDIGGNFQRQHFHSKSGSTRRPRLHPVPKLRRPHRSQDKQ